MRRYKNHFGSLVLALLTHLAAAVTVLVLGFLVSYVLVRGVPNLRPEMFALTYTSENQSMLPAIINTCTMTLFSLLIIFRYQLVGLYTQTPHVVEMAAMLMIMVAIFQPLQTSSVVISGCLRGAGDTFVPSILNFLSIWVVRLGLAVLLVGRLGLHGMWIGMAAELCVRGLLMLYRQKTTKYFSLYRKPLSEAKNS